MTGACALLKGIYIMTKILEGKVAIVTGSGQGIGRAIACKLAADGAKVVTNNRCPEPTSNKQISDEQYNSLPAELRAKFEAAYALEAGNAETTAAKIIAEGGEASPFYADIGKFDQAKALVEHAVKTYGKVDMVVTHTATDAATAELSTERIFIMKFLLVIIV